MKKRGIEALNQNLYGNNKATKKSFFTITYYLYYLYRIKQLADASILSELQNKGVYILAFDFKENGNQFLASLNEKIKKRNEEYGVYPGNPMPEEFKESFFGELYCEAYKAQDFPLQISFHRCRGIPYLSDTETEFIHIQNGERLTVNQPEKFDRCIYICGPCVVLGRRVSDQYTISSLLQDEMNQAGFRCKVINRGFPGRIYSNVERLHSEAFKQGDIVVLDQYGLLLENYPMLNLTDALEKHHATADWFHDSVRHCNHKANQVYAHAIYEELIPVLQQPPKGREPIELDHDYIDRVYLSRYFSNFDCTCCGTVGAIVMNCNPFTFGHRFLLLWQLNNRKR